jgi:diguanylate cyclase (GGDEF)-like protein
MTPDPTEDLVRRDALAGSMASYLWAAVGCVFAAALCAAVFRDSLLAPTRWWWLAAMVLVQGTAVATALTYMREPRSRGLRAWMTPFLLCSVAQGLLWSGLPLMLHGPSMTETQWAVLLIFYSACSAAAIATLCANYVISASYFAVLWLPAIAQLLIAGGTTNLLFALGGAMLLGLALVFAHHLHTALLAAIRLGRRLEHDASHDPLAGLPNRATLLARADAATAARAGTARSFGLLFVDLDRFKQVNDTLGHRGGDALLKQVGARLSAAMREGDTVARVGGDEFVALVHGTSEADAHHVAGRLVSAMEAPFTVQGQELLVTASVGIDWSDGSIAPSDLLVNADRAMFRAKETGRRRTVTYDREMAQWMDAHRGMEQDLRRAIGAGQLEVAAQPIVDLATRMPVGVELLARWNRPGHGPVSPALFIPVAEETGLVVELGRWMLDEACHVASRWSRDHRLAPLQINVNISGRHLLQADLPGDVRAALARFDARPEALCVELTETASADDLPRAGLALSTLRAMGVGVAIDDFGTGWSSLTYLHMLPTTTVKVDRSFVAIADRDARAAAIVRACAELAGVDGRATVAEGIETEGQATLSRRLGCSRGQGWLFGRPAPVGEIEQLLREALSLPAAATAA